MLMDGSSPHFARRKEGRGDECWAIDEFFAGNRQAKLPCGTRALWDALSARQDNNGRPEPGAPLRSAPVYDGAGPSDRNKNSQNTRAGRLPRKLSSFKNNLGDTPSRRLLPRPG